MSHIQRSWIAWAVAIALATLPRVLRVVYPEVWIEDAKYLYHAYALSIGQQPYIDGIYAHPPTFEGVLAILYRLTGGGYRIAEYFSASIVALGTLLLYDLCRRITGRWVALAACAVFSFSPLLFRYHVYEREVFTVFLATAAFWAQTAWPNATKSAFFTGVIAGLAVTIKLSALFYLPPLLLVYLMRRSLRQAAICLGAFVIVGCGTWIFIFSYFGWTAYFQNILFHFVKGGTPGLYSIFTTYVIPALSVILVSGTGGLLLGALLDRHDVLSAAALLLAEFVFFFTIISESVVPHNMIDLLLPLALGTGYGLGALRAVIKVKEGRWARVVIVVGSGLLFIPFGALKTEYISSGWGYIPRAELRSAAAFLIQHVPPDVPISAPQYLAAEARRIKIIDDRELAGPYMWMIQTLKDKGFEGLKQHKVFGSWGRLVVKTIPLWQFRVDEAISERKAGAVVWDSLFPEWRPYYLIDIEKEKCCRFFSSAGYSIRYQSGPFVIWLPNPG